MNLKFVVFIVCGHLWVLIYLHNYVVSKLSGDEFNWFSAYQSGVILLQIGSIFKSGYFGNVVVCDLYILCF